MGKFLNGLFVGIGIGLFIAPQTGEETRRLIMERVATLRKNLSSEDDQHILINAYPPEARTLPLEPEQPIARFSSEPQEVVTPTVLLETPGTETEDMVKPPTEPSPSDVPERTTKRKTPPRTSSTNKTRGQNRS